MTIFGPRNNPDAIGFSKYVKSFVASRFRRFTGAEEKIMELVAQKHHANEQNIKTVNILEIGFGCGHFTANLAKVFKNKIILASEVYRGGILALAKMMLDKKIENILIFARDGRLVVNEIDNLQLDYVFVLFPDPWPKRRHNCRRIISKDFLLEVLPKIKRSGSLVVATDDADYQAWIANVLDLMSLKYLQICDVAEMQRYEWFFETKYFKKAAEAGRSPRYFVVDCA